MCIRDSLQELGRQSLAGVVRLVDVTSIEHHELLLIERVEGRTLDGARLPRAEALRVAVQLAEVLAALHERRLVYLDVKPRNLIFDGKNLRLCDFGMAQEGE